MKPAATQLELAFSRSHTSGSTVPATPFHPPAPRTYEHPTAAIPTLLDHESETLAPGASLERRRAHRQIISHHWECVVEAVNDDTLVATLRSLAPSAADSEKEAEIPLEEVSEDDRELLSPGAIFYWTIGYDIAPGGSRRRFSQIKFRRLPAWTKRDLQRVERDAADYFELLGGGNARGKAAG